MRRRSSCWFVVAVGMFVMPLDSVAGDALPAGVSRSYERLVLGDPVGALAAARDELREDAEFVRTCTLRKQGGTFRLLYGQEAWLEDLLGRLQESAVRYGQVATVQEPVVAAVGALAGPGMMARRAARAWSHASALGAMLGGRAGFREALAKPAFGLTALHRAVASRDRGLVERLLAGGESVQQPDAVGLRPLGVAAFGGWDEGVDLLLVSGAEPLGDEGPPLSAGGLSGLDPRLWSTSLAAAGGHADLVGRLVAAVQASRRGSRVMPPAALWEAALDAAWSAGRREAYRELSTRAEGELGTCAMRRQRSRAASPEEPRTEAIDATRAERRAVAHSSSPGRQAAWRPLGGTGGLVLLRLPRSSGLPPTGWEWMADPDLLTSRRMQVGLLRASEGKPVMVVARAATRAGVERHEVVGLLRRRVPEDGSIEMVVRQADVGDLMTWLRGGAWSLRVGDEQGWFTLPGAGDPDGGLVGRRVVSYDDERGLTGVVVFVAR